MLLPTHTPAQETIVHEGPRKQNAKVYRDQAPQNVHERSAENQGKQNRDMQTHDVVELHNEVLLPTHTSVQ